MKNKNVIGLASLTVAGGLIASCNVLKDLSYEVTPDPLEMHGDSVKVTAKVQIPEKGIHKKAYAEITPSIAGHNLKPIAIQGEKAVGNGQVINFKAGGTVSYEDIIPYHPDMEYTDLVVSGTAKKGKKEIQVPETAIAKATVITPLRIQNDDKAMIGSDAFERITPEVLAAQLNFDQGRSNVKNSELKDEDIKELESFIAKAKEDPKIELKSINIVAYASPEGEEDKNNTLSTDRADQGKQTAMKLSKKVGNEQASSEDFYSATGNGEDWGQGFMDALNASSIDNKDVIKRVVEMNGDPAAREKAMKDLVSVYPAIEKEVLPPLRRSEIRVNYDKHGYTDEELTALAKSNPDTLTVEELLFAATLDENLEEQLRIYREVERIYPEDWRGANNVGVVLYMQNNRDGAKAQFEKAAGMEDNDVTKNNLGMIARQEGDRDKATELLEAAGSSNETSYNLGLIAIQNGEYDAAVSNMGDNQTFNKALAEVLNGDLEGALNTIDASEEKESAMAYYLKAIIGARQDNYDMVKTNLKSAVAKDSSLKATAKKDREFVKYENDADFTAIVG